MGRRFWRRATAVTQTPELELVRRVDGPSGTAIEVVVRWSASLDALASTWEDHTVTVAAHWLDRTGAVVEWDGPRASSPVDAQWLPSAPQRRMIRLGSAPAGATAASIELVAEGLQWGGEAGLTPLVVIIGGRAPTLPVTRRDHDEAPGGESAPITAELRLTEIMTTADGITVDSEIRWSAALDSLAGKWSGTPVILTAQWLDAAGVPIGVPPMTSAPVDLAWLSLTPQIRRIHLGPVPAGGRGIAVNVEAVGRQERSGAELETLHVVFGEPMIAGPVPAPDRGHGPGAPDEPPSETRAWLATAFPEDANEDEMRAYVGADLARFLMSVQLMGGSPGKILEIGSNPYFISRLIAARFPDSTLSMTNYFGFAGDSITQRVVDAAGGEVASFTSELVDTEIERLPYPDESFDTALLCEVIEHLIKDPVFQLSEIARVLRPRGRLILTTPNVARRNNRARLAQRQGIYDPYSQYGPHGRHNREYTATELFELVSGIGFTPITYLTRPVHSVPDPDEAWFRGDGDDGAGDYHFLVLERAAVLTHPRRPDWLYR